MYQLNFYVPKSHLETVKTACFDEGAGSIGSYEKCAWQVVGMGQYLPTKKSQPHQGSIDQLESTQEHLVQMVVPDELIKKVMKAMIEAHPYETPAYGAWKLLTLDDLSS